MRSLSIVIPAYNEQENIEALMAGIPVAELLAHGWDTEVLVVDNASTDGTGATAAALGARVVVQPVRGYGNAYKAGLANARGDVLACGDADLTYPFDALPTLLQAMETERLDFLTTDRLHDDNLATMSPSHMWGNHVLSTLSRRLFSGGARDSQSGMWIVRRAAWRMLDVRSGGMAFSQEIKHEALRAGLSWREVAIEYRARGGEVKLNATRDGVRNLVQMVHHRYRRPAVLAGRATVVLPREASVPAAVTTSSATAERAPENVPSPTGPTAA